MTPEILLPFMIAAGLVSHLILLLTMLDSMVAIRRGGSMNLTVEGFWRILIGLFLGTMFWAWLLL